MFQYFLSSSLFVRHEDCVFLFFLYFKRFFFSWKYRKEIVVLNIYEDGCRKEWFSTLKKKHVLASFSLYHEKWRFKVKLITKFKKENKGMYRNAMIEKFAQVNIFFKGLTSAILTVFFLLLSMYCDIAMPICFNSIRNILF